MKTLSMPAGTILIPFNDNTIEINRKVYKNLTVAARLLNISEIDKVLRMDLEKSDVGENIYDEIFSLCVIDIPGVDGVINLDETPAGFVSSVSKTILSMSLQCINDPISTSKKYAEEVTLIDNMCAIISRYLSIPFNEVRLYPIDRVFSLFSVCYKTFPNEIQSLEEASEEANSA